MHGSLLLVDDHPWVAEAIAQLAEAAGWSPVHLAIGVEQGRVLAARHRPRLVNVDLSTDRDEALDLVRSLRVDQPHVLVTMMVADTDPVRALAHLRAGATAVIPKGAHPAQVIEAFDAVAQGQTWLPVALIGPVLHAALHPPPPTEWQELVAGLSDREAEVLGLLVAGLDRAQVADRLTISLNTARTHVRNVLRKLGAHSSVEAVSIALRAGLRPTDTGSDPAT